MFHNYFWTTRNKQEDLETQNFSARFLCMQSTLKCFYLFISAYNSWAFFACCGLLTISTAIIHSQLIVLLIYVIIPFFPDPEFMNIFSMWEKSQNLPQSNSKDLLLKGCRLSEMQLLGKFCSSQWLWTGTGSEAAERWQMKSEISAVVCRVPRTLSANRFCGQQQWRLLISLCWALPSFSLGWADWIHTQE